MNFEIIKARGSRGMLVLQKHSPEILMGAGIVGVIGATVLACRATLKAKEVVEEVQLLTEGLNDEEDIELKTQLIVIGGLEVVKLYAPAVGVGVLSIAMLIQSRNILSRRNAGLLAAYKAVDEAYKKYRKRVRDEFGDEVDNYLVRKKPLDEEMKIVTEKGKDIDFETAVDLTPEEMNMVEFGASQYAKFFDESSPQWRHSNDQNIFFLKAQQTNANVQLTVRGHVFLNDVYKMLGLPETKAGCVVGWVKGHGDDVIDFGIFNSVNNFNNDFINGYNRDSILLDFNVDGWIWDLI